MIGDAALQWDRKRVKLTRPKTGAPDASEQEPADSAETFIGSGALFEGTLQLRGNFRIDSEFRGALRTDGKVIVGPLGSIVGDIQASEVEIFGAVVGDVSARREVVLREGSRLHGGVTTACLEIERHSFFSGNSVMTEPQRQSRSASRDASYEHGPSHIGA
jgi:cytoskeletal protein CcmA (bactofilin family)